MNVTALSTGSALSRIRPDRGGDAGALGHVGVVARPASLAPANPAEGLRAVTGNRIPPPGEGGKIEQPRSLAADRMQQVQADIPQDSGMSSLMAMLLKFAEAQSMAR